MINYNRLLEYIEEEIEYCLSKTREPYNEGYIEGRLTMLEEIKEKILFGDLDLEPRQEI